MEKLSLRDFIEQREAEIKDLRAKLLLELKELKLAKDAIGQLAGQQPISPEKPSAAKHSGNGYTIKEMSLDVLRKRGSPQTAEQIITGIKGLFDVDVVRSSLSPQLSRLKRDNRLALNESSGEWSIVEEGLNSHGEVFGTPKDQVRGVWDDEPDLEQTEGQI